MTDFLKKHFPALKVVATDAEDNRPERAGADSLVSAPFLVDGTPPSIADVDVEAGRGRIEVRGAVRDAGSPIDRVEVALDYGDWKPALPGDGMFDSPDELLSLLPAGLPEPFTTADIVAASGRSKRLAMRAVYCLERSGVIVRLARQGRFATYGRMRAVAGAQA